MRLFPYPCLLFPQNKNLRNDLIQGALIGFGLAFVSAQIYARIKATKVNGWITMYGLGEPGNGMFLRAAHAQLFLGPVNVPEEAMYWWTNVRWRGPCALRSTRLRHALSAGQLPPNNAFWSLTMGDAKNHFVANPTQPLQRQRPHRASCKTPMVRSIFTSRRPLRRGTSPTGCPRHRAILSSGCACTSPARPFSTASTGAAGGRSELMDMNIPAFADLRFGHGRGMVPFHLLLAAHVAVRVQERRSSLKGSATALSRSIRFIRSPKHSLQIPSSRPPRLRNVLTAGVNHDTLLTVGWLDLSKGPLVLHVPDMNDRYYSVQFTDPSKNTIFAYVGTRTTGTQAGDYLITGPRLERNGSERHEADILAEQLGARDRARACGKR